ncbi:hypothetical protein HNQ56_001343 [Anaerotaenia torta]
MLYREPLEPVHVHIMEGVPSGIFMESCAAIANIAVIILVYSVRIEYQFIKQGYQKKINFLISLFYCPSGVLDTYNSII